MWQNKSGHGCTRFKSLHCYWRGVIPETLKHFSKLTSPQLPQQLDGCTVNLPLVHSVVRQAVSLRDLHLQQQDREREREGLSLFTDTGGEGGELGGQLTFLHASPRHVHRPSVCLE